MTNETTTLDFQSTVREDTRLMRAETPQEIELLKLFRSMTRDQQQALLTLVTAAADFHDAMRAA
jgi:hypothetical protein